jgi:hypothetical protein
VGILLAPYSPSYILSPHSLPFYWYHPSDETCSALLFSDFVFLKKWHFCFFKIVIQEISLWHFRVYMYYNPNWLSPPLLPLTLCLFSEPVANKAPAIIMEVPEWHPETFQLSYPKHYLGR